MRIFTLAFLGKIFAALFIAVSVLLGFGPKEWAAAVLGTEQPLWVWVIRIALIGGSGLLIWFVFIMPAINAAKIMFPYHYRPQDTDKIPLRRLIPLPVAAQAAYEKLRGRTLSSQKLPAKFADMKYGNTAHPLSWFGVALLGRGAIPLFGYHAPSTILEIVPTNLVKASGHLSDDVNSIKLYGEKEPQYKDLSIKKTDFHKRLKEIESWHGDDI